MYIHPVDTLIPWIHTAHVHTTRPSWMQICDWNPTPSWECHDRLSGKEMHSQAMETAASRQVTLRCGTERHVVREHLPYRAVLYCTVPTVSWVRCSRSSRHRGRRVDGLEAWSSPQLRCLPDSSSSTTMIHSLCSHTVHPSYCVYYCVYSTVLDRATYSSLESSESSRRSASSICLRTLPGHTEGSGKILACTYCTVQYMPSLSPFTFYHISPLGQSHRQGSSPSAAFDLSAPFHD